GEMIFKGQPVHMRSPHDALKLGIAMIHQELLPFRDLTVAENIFMGHEPVARWLGWIDDRAMRRESGRILSELAADISPSRKMRELRVAEIQVVEIAKALAHRAALIIMDEPTSALSEREAARLFTLVADFKRRGVAVIYISHKL